ncbi:MAG: imidazole glycerol phosphate synthase subunit HisH [Candidatus Aenigmarchaeota archaeon]|nr:imidazole glycerol phosphate synthase subunit HisH [Candidatus Aenigmarchaeota archaeon]MCK5177120.1 imidazole glycerol phosphate synthase subunit HisH [Candidatus Aenigmarchaeota archaeon]
MIYIINYGAGNIGSITNALEYLGYEYTITENPDMIKEADKLILPGVGAFGEIMDNLKKQKLIEPIKKFIDSGKPFFGICLGLQVLFERSEESPGVKGLGLFEGEVVKFRQGKVPQIGWNKIRPANQNEFFREGFVYFVNSFYIVPKNTDIIATKTDYYLEFTSAVQCKNITATQFHPEKSGEFGLDILRRWLEC